MACVLVCAGGWCLPVTVAEASWCAEAAAAWGGCHDGLLWHGRGALLALPDTIHLALPSQLLPGGWLW
jgi:hypothetical protein